MLEFYRWFMNAAQPFLVRLLERRIRAGKEDPERLDERKGLALRPRPNGRLYWIHAASVGEAQSALILIRTLLERDKDLHILVTTGTVTSAGLLDKNLPERAFHQFYPLDHPAWARRFLRHWNPDFILWMESELWPNMLLAIQEQNIPAALINARLSLFSYKKWKIGRLSARKLLSTFSVILTQTETEKGYFSDLGGRNVHVTDNLKYSAAPLKADSTALKAFLASLRTRPCWIYASTHEGEEELAARVHLVLKAVIPDILTLIVPRHPNRREEIEKALSFFKLKSVFRGENAVLPDEDTDLYVADTLGELGLFYRAAPVAVIGRSFSEDGGGGHNPVEAAQLHCAVLHGPGVQNLQDVFDEMNRAGAAYMVQNENQLTDEIRTLLQDEKLLHDKQEKAFAFSGRKAKVLKRVLGYLEPYLLDIENKSP